MRPQSFSAFALAFALALASLGAAPAGAENRTVRVAIGSTSFAWMPLYVAGGAGYFEDEGLRLEIVNVAANATPLAAILNGDADVGGAGSQTVFGAIDKGQPIKILTPMVNAYTSTIFVRKGLMAEKGVTRASPIADRVRALTGLKLASTATGAGPHLMYRYLFARYLDLNVDNVSEVVPIGDSAATLAAMRRGVIDVSAFSPPVPEKAVADGIGEIMIDFINGDVPEVTGAVYVVLAVTDEKLAKDGPMVASFVRAIQRANELAAKDIDKAGEAARKYMGQMDSKLYLEGVRVMKPALPTVATTSIEGLQAFMDLMKVGGITYPNTNVETITANDFVEKALAGKI